MKINRNISQLFRFQITESSGINRLISKLKIEKPEIPPRLRKINGVQCTQSLITVPLSGILNGRIPTMF